ncbi:MAG: hypothetical protein V1928_05415 [Parcubacteria group bacterium]
MTKYSQNFRDNAAPATKRGSKFSKLFFYCLVGAFIVALTGAYLFEVNSIAAKGFQVRDLQKQISDIRDYNDELALQLIDLKASPELNERIESLNMIPAEKIAYYDAAGELVARK